MKPIHRVVLTEAAFIVGMSEKKFIHDKPKGLRLTDVGGMVKVEYGGKKNPSNPTVGYIMPAIIGTVEYIEDALHLDEGDEVIEGDYVQKFSEEKGYYVEKVEAQQ